jgi:hypothetical protein
MDFSFFIFYEWKKKVNQSEVIMKKQRFLGRRSPNRRIIHFPSIKCNELKYCESRLEYDRLLQLEFDQSVAHYEAQPAPIHYTNDNGKEVRYTPDLLITALDRKVSIEEVKPYELSIKPRVKRKHALIASIYDDSDIPFHVVTEQDIYNGKSNDNHRKLYRYLSEPVSNEIKKVLSTDFKTFTGTIGLLKNELNRRAYPSYTAMLLLAHGYFQADLTHLINDLTEVATNESYL